MKRQSYWDITPQEAIAMGIDINPWQPDPDNPYFNPTGLETC